MIRKNVIKKVLLLKGQFLSILFLIGKKVREPTDNKSKTIKYLSDLHTFQDGGAKRS